MDDHFDICRVFEISKFDIARLTCILSLRMNSGFITSRPGPEVLKLFSCSTQLSMQFILLINVKLSTIVYLSVLCGTAWLSCVLRFLVFLSFSHMVFRIRYGK